MATISDYYFDPSVLNPEEICNFLGKVDDLPESLQQLDIVMYNDQLYIYYGNEYFRLRRKENLRDA